MKKLFVLPIIISVGFGYEGCGATKKEALNNLSQSIYVNVSNRFKKEEKVTISGVVQSLNRNIENETTQTSDLTLKNVKYIRKNGEICAVVNKSDVIASAQEDLKFLLTFNSKNMPIDFKEKQKMANKILAKISFVKAILNVNEIQLKKLNKLEKEMKDILKSGEVTFNVNVPNASIYISGIDKEFSPSTPIVLPEGEYSYKIEAPDRCPVSGSFTIKKNQSFTINKSLGFYPTITFTSNQKSVKVKLNGYSVPLNAPQTVKKCEGKAFWQMSFEDQLESGEVELKPDLKETINRDFTPKLEMRKLKEKVDYYINSQEVTLNYGYGFASKKHKEWDEEKRAEIRKFNNYGIYKLGFGVLAGTKTDWTAKDMNELEIAISGRIQMPEFFDKPIHLYKVVILPYIGVEGGWDIYKFIDKGDYELSDITSIFRGTVGVTFLFHKQFGIDVEYSKGFLEKKDNVVTAGFVLDF